MTRHRALSAHQQQYLLLPTILRAFDAKRRASSHEQVITMILWSLVSRLQTLATLLGLQPDLTYYLGGDARATSSHVTATVTSALTWRPSQARPRRPTGVRAVPAAAITAPSSRTWGRTRAVAS